MFELPETCPYYSCTMHLQKKSYLSDELAKWPVAILVMTKFHGSKSHNNFAVPPHWYPLEKCVLFLMNSANMANKCSLHPFSSHNEMMADSQVNKVIPATIATAACSFIPRFLQLKGSFAHLTWKWKMPCKLPPIDKMQQISERPTEKLVDQYVRKDSNFLFTLKKCMCC